VDLAPPAPAAPSPSPPPPDVAQEQPEPATLLLGVAALLADRLGVDALWVRIAFVLLALVGGIGVIVYGALWLALIHGAEPDRRWARLAGGAVLVGGVPLVLTQGFDFFSGPAAVLALLVGLAVALWQPRTATPAATAPAGRPSEVVTTPSDGADVAETAAAGTGGRGGDGTTVARRLRRLPRRAPRPVSVLGRLALGIALVVAAVGALIDQANGGRLHPEQWLGAAAIVCGGGLLVGAVAGRARWLIVPAALFAGAGFAAGEAARIGVEPTALFGDEHVGIGQGSSGDRREHVVVGSVQVSIDGVPATPITVDARSGIGEVSIWAVDDVTIEVAAEVGHGDIRVTGEERPDGTYRIGPEGEPDVVVLARVGRGDIRVEQWTRRPEPELPAVPVDGQQYVAEGVAVTAGGQVVLGDGQAVIGTDDTVLTGQTLVRDRVTVITTSYGDFQLLPGGLLLTPYGELLDLRAVRGESGAPVVPETVAPDAESGPTSVPVTVPGG
jgi:phage shock protein PspC (stress-responsive transcriptional regulator)/uncharacterized Zn-binding protein involved in type VI secretion